MGWFNDAFDTIRHGGSSVLQTAQSALSSVSGAASSAASHVSDSVDNAVDRVGDSLDNAVNAPGSFLDKIGKDAMIMIAILVGGIYFISNGERSSKVVSQGIQVAADKIPSG